MTTIAYRNGVMAADSQVTDNGRREGGVMKLYRLSDGAIAGFSGDVALAQDVIAWLDGRGGRPAIGQDEQFDLLIASREGISFVQSNFRRGKIKAEYAAVGSGVNFAYGAMAAGADAIGAVEAAIKHDVYSCGPVVTMVLDQ